MRTLLVTMALVLTTFQPPADRMTWTERQWCDHLAQQWGAEVEVRTPDGSRVDLLIPGGEAWEVDFAPKWAQGVGQALYYSAATHQPPGLVLIMREPAKQQKYYLRALVVCHKYGIRLEVVQP